MMYKILHPIDDLDRLYVSRKESIDLKTTFKKAKKN